MIAQTPKPSFDKTRSVGFPQSNSTGGDSTAKTASKPKVAFSQPAPLKKQAKGRWFVSCVLISLLGFIAISLWNEFGRYQAYGEIEGTVIKLSASASGRIVSIQVQEGDYVRAGQTVAVVDARELKMNLRRLKSDLQIALSNLRVRMAEISERNRDSISDRIDRRVDYHRLVGEFHTKQARLEELNNTFATNESLRGGNAISDAEYVASKAAYEGLRAEIADLQAAIGVLEPEVNATEVDNVKELLQAEQARILDIQSELVEIESLIQSAQIVAPVDGRIVKRHCHAGEYVDSREPIVELLQSGSIEAVVYLPQHHASLLAINDEVQLVVTPLGEKQTFRVRRISPELVPPPQALQANYRAFKGLVRVRAEPIDSANDLSRWVGAELALPRFAFRAPTYSESVMRQLGFATATSATTAKGE